MSELASRQLLTTAQAAAYLHLSPSTLEKMRCYGRGPKYLKVGGRVLYRTADLEAFLEACVVETPGEGSKVGPGASLTSH